MPKKLTKIQVKSKLNIAKQALSLVLIDKFRQEGSFSPMSIKVLLELIDKIERAMKRMK
jgi:hypothetical protein